ncbi:MAG TPA: hypothetical protein VF297_05055 [Pyrinomonadaceae bacterium]
MSLTRPWPFAFDNGPVPKRVENRGWKPRDYVGHYVALHAAKSWDEDGREFIADKTGLYVPSDAESPRSQIFAVCRYVGHVTSATDRRLKNGQDAWFFGPVGWLLGDYVRLVEPVPCVGARGLWTFDERPQAFARLREVYARSVEGTRSKEAA